MDFKKYVNDKIHEKVISKNQTKQRTQSVKAGRIHIVVSSPVRVGNRSKFQFSFQVRSSQHK